MISVIGIIFFTNIVQAENKIDSNTSSVELYSLGEVPLLLRYAEIDQKTKYVFHKYNGVEYPAYCLNETLNGVTTTNSYSVTMENELSDITLWRIIINGYPYKSIEELGCSNIMEAYAATQHAIYSYLKGDLEAYDYTPVKEQGTRVLNALKTILQNGRNSKEVPTEKNRVYYGKAPNGNLQNYALTKIEEKKEEKEPEQKEEKVTTESQKTETKKLPLTGM